MSSFVRKLASRPALTALALVAALVTGAASSASAATVTRIFNGDTTTATFLFRGSIVRGDLGRLQEQTAKVPAGQRITLMLESGGGLIDEGISLGRYIYSSRITTIAIQGPGCHSACTFMFLAGRDNTSAESARIMFKGARIGFHQGGLGGSGSQNPSANDVSRGVAIGQEIVKEVNAYFNEIKADPEFLTLFLSAPHNTVTLLNEFDALRLGVFVFDPAIKQLVSPGQFGRKQ